MHELGSETGKPWAVAPSSGSAAWVGNPEAVPSRCALTTSCGPIRWMPEVVPGQRTQLYCPAPTRSHSSPWWLSGQERLVG